MAWNTIPLELALWEWYLKSWYLFQRVVKWTECLLLLWFGNATWDISQNPSIFQKFSLKIQTSCFRNVVNYKFNQGAQLKIKLHRDTNGKIYGKIFGEIYRESHFSQCKLLQIVTSNKVTWWGNSVIENLFC